MTEYRYKFLPGGNRPDFPRIEAELRRRRVKADVSKVQAGRMYRFPVGELHKLPIDRRGLPYVGYDGTGWELEDNWDRDWEEARVRYKGSDWWPVDEVGKAPRAKWRRN